MTYNTKLSRKEAMKIIVSLTKNTTFLCAASTLELKQMSLVCACVLHYRLINISHPISMVNEGIHYFYSFLDV
jgi:hypothetical protein